MIIEFEQTREDLIEYNEFLYSKKNGNLKRQWFLTKIGIGLLIFVLTMKIGGIMELGYPYNVFVPTLLLGAMIVGFLISDPIKIIVNKMLKLNPDLIGVRRFEVSDSEVIMNVGDSKNIHPIDNIIDVIETENLIMLFIAENVAFLIPKKEFSSVEAIEDFKNQFRV